MRLFAMSFTILAVVFTIVAESHGATIRVAKDGSGDFTVIADGVLAAASGDTVTIGPGTYPETRMFETPGGPYEYVAEVEQTELTIIGDHRDAVVIGPETPASDLQRGPSGLVTTVNGNIRISGVTLRNLSSGMQGNGVWMEATACRFTGCYIGVDSFLTGYTTVLDSEFIENPKLGMVVFEIRGSTGALVEGCTFRDNRTALDFQPPNCELRDTSFEGGIIGAQVSFGGSVTVERCTFGALSGTAFTISQGAQAYIYDCTFSSQMYANINVDGLLVGSGNELAGASHHTVKTTYNSAVAFDDNHILNAGGYSVLASDGGPPEVRHQDFTGNFWGTTDMSQIDEWIHDVNDDEEFNSISIDYLPIADQPIPTESTSFGELKARY